jgi:hypothetical protein
MVEEVPCDHLYCMRRLAHFYGKEDLFFGDQVHEKTFHRDDEVGSHHIHLHRSHQIEMQEADHDGVMQLHAVEDRGSYCWNGVE